MKDAVTIVIPKDLTFADLQMTCNPDGTIDFNPDVIDRVLAVNGVSWDRFETKEDAEDFISKLTTQWYIAHLKAGGQPDPVAEAQIAEIEAEERAGQTVSHQPGEGVIWQQHTTS